MRARLLVAACAAAAFLLPALPANASVEIGVNAVTAALHVDAAGDAQATWTATDGSHHSLVVSHDGSLHIGASLPGADVSHPAAIQVPWALAVREAGGTYYALQSWRRLDSGPVELRFARWTGPATLLTLRVVCCKWGSVNVEGQATFHGKPIYGEHATLQGDPLDPYGRNVYLDSLQGGHWTRMMGILTHKPTGTFSLWIRSNWVGTAYRGTIPGPNLGWTLGPDALAEAASEGR